MNPLNLKHLSRNTRETLLMIGFVACVLLPLMTKLPLWSSGLILLILFWRSYAALTSIQNPPRYLVYSIAIACLLTTYLHFGNLIGRDPGVNLVALLLAIKTLELRAKKDAWVVFFLGFFIQITNFMYSQSILTALWMLLALIFILLTLIGAQSPQLDLPLKLRLRSAIKMLLLGTPLMLLLFVIFPRFASPLYGASASSARTGLSEEMRPGQIAQLASDSSIAFRVKFDGALPRANELYWRGPVLERYNGLSWTMLDEGISSLPPSDLSVNGRPFNYTITTEPAEHTWLLVLEAAQQRPAIPDNRVIYTSDLQMRLVRSTSQRLQYQATSYPQFRYGVNEQPSRLLRATWYPQEKNPRLYAWARKYAERFNGGSVDAHVAANYILDYFKDNGFEYTLVPKIYGQHDADEFMFDARTGFCENYAQAMALALRAMNVPARVVTGYLGGEYNPIDGYLEVRQSDAHAWVEYWVERQGWVRADPTTAATPSRYAYLPGERLTQSSANPLLSAVNSYAPWIAKQLQLVTQTMNAVNNLWNQKVLQYSRLQQEKLFQDWLSAKGKFLTTTLTVATVMLIVGFILLVSVGVAFKRKTKKDTFALLLDQSFMLLSSRGVPITRSMGLRNAALLCNQQLPPTLGTQVAQWLLNLERLRYAHETAPNELTHSLLPYQKTWTQLAKQIRALPKHVQT